MDGWVSVFGPVFLGVVGFIAGYQFNRPIKVVAATRCGDSGCSSRSDPRCAAGNCTYHCQAIIGCNGACIEVWKKSDKAEELARETMRKARAE